MFKWNVWEIKTVETKAQILLPSTYLLQFRLSFTVKAVLYLSLEQDTKHQNKDLTQLKMQWRYGISLSSYC